MVFGPASQLGMSVIEETPPVEYIPGSSSEDAEVVIKAVYQQVLGNAYIMESERAAIPESQFKRGELSVREFVRALAKSDAYRSRFFDTCPRYRFIELNFLHLLGRTPDDLEEMRAHSTILDTEGYETEIDSYLDSDEYQSTYGENIVPYCRGYKTSAGIDMVGFTHFFAVKRGPSSSDFKGSISGKSPVLNKYVINNIPLAIIPPSSGSSGRQQFADEKGQVYRIEVTGYSSIGRTNQASRIRSSNKVYFVSFENLSQEYQRIHKQGGVISSITPV